MFDNVRAGGPKIQNQAIVAWFWAACGLLDVDDVDVDNGAVVLYPLPPPSHNSLTCGGGE